MTATIRLSLKGGKALFELLRGVEVLGYENCAAVAQLASALSKASRASTTRRTLRKPKEAKHKAKREARQEVRAAVMARANGRCEGCRCRVYGPLELDHFFGRARSESLETCWALDGNCHNLKTDNRPSAQRWLTIFATHCAKHGYTEAEARARKRLAFVEARGTP